MLLYHGSNTDIKAIDLEMCKPFKDFGRGFYLTVLARLLMMTWLYYSDSMKMV